MPQLFALNELDPWTFETRPFAGPAGPNLKWWPQPNTVRTDFRFRLPSDPVYRPAASRHYGRVEVRKGTVPDEVTSCWYWYDLVPTGNADLTGDSGEMEAGLRVQRQFTYLDLLPLFQQNNNFQTGGVRVLEYISFGSEPVSARIWEYPDINVAGGDLYRFNYDRSQPLITDLGSAGPSVLTLSHGPNQPVATGDWPLRWATWFATSENYDLTPYQVI